MARNSFTLIEMMVVVSIILLVSGFSIAWYGNLTKDQNLGHEIERIRALLETAKTNSATGNTSLCGNSDTAYSSGHEVEFGSGTVVLRPLCNTEPTPITYRPSDQLIMVTPVATIRFDANGAPDMPSCLPFAYVGAAKCRYINVNETGLITSGTCSQCSPNYICPCD